MGLSTPTHFREARRGILGRMIVIASHYSSALKRTRPRYH